MPALSRGFSLFVCLVLIFSALPIMAQFQHGVPWRDANVQSGSAPAGAHLSYFGGPVISNAHIVQVLYGTGSYNPQVAGTSSPTMGNFFSDLLGTNSGYISLLGQYSTNFSGGTNQIIGNGTFGGIFQITPSPANNGSTIDDSNIQAELLAQISAGHLPATVLDPAGNVNTIYMIYFPPGKTITERGSTSCVAGGFCAYHGTTSNELNSKHLLYGVMPDLQAGSGCSNGCGTSSVFGNYTTVTSHELSETITDADVGIATSFAAPLAWYDTNNGEIGDICNLQQGSYTANGTTYTIQLEFSNAANNCVLPPPTPGPGMQCSINGLSTTTGLVWDQSNNTLWAAISGGNYVAHIDSNCNILARVSVGRYPFGVVWDGQNIWVTNYEDNTVSKIRTSTSTVVGTYAVGSHPRGVILVGNYILVANEGSNTITKLDDATGALVATIPVGSAPYYLVGDPLNTGFFVANAGSNTIMRVDLNGNILQTLATPSQPGFLSVGLAPRTANDSSTPTLWVGFYNNAEVAAYALTNPVRLLGTVSVSNYGHPTGVVGYATAVAYTVTHSGYFLDIEISPGTNNLFIAKAVPLETGSQTHLYDIIRTNVSLNFWIDDIDAGRIIRYQY